jgi:undecaprenyl-diphosphatase
MRSAPLVGVKSRSLPWRAFVLFGITALATYVFVVLAENVLEGDVDAIDKAVALAIHRADTPALDWLMIGLTYVGSGPGLVASLVATAIWLLKHNHRRTALILACNGLAAQGLVFVLKQFVQRPRPTLFDEITRPETFSFPSGHALSAMAIYGGIAAVIITLHPRQRTAVVVAAAVLIAGIGFSRIYLGVHWPFDVLAGFAAGVPLLVATVHLLHMKNGLKLSRRDDTARTRRITDADFRKLT